MKDAPSLDDWMLLADAAAQLDVTPNDLKQLISQGAFKTIHKVGGHTWPFLVSMAEVDAVRSEVKRGKFAGVSPCDSWEDSEIPTIAVGELWHCAYCSGELREIVELIKVSGWEVLKGISGTRSDTDRETEIDCKVRLILECRHSTTIHIT